MSSFPLLEFLSVSGRVRASLVHPSEAVPLNQVYSGVWLDSSHRAVSFLRALTAFAAFSFLLLLLLARRSLNAEGAGLPYTTRRRAADHYVWLATAAVTYRNLVNLHASRGSS